MRQRGGDITLSITTQMSYCHGDAKWDKRGKGGEKRRRENEGGKEGRREGVSAVTKEVNKETSTTPKKSHWPAMAVT